MKYFKTILIFLIITSCSFNTNSDYWTENNVEKTRNLKKLNTILKNIDDITAMSLEEYKIYIDDKTRKSKYPNIDK